MQRREFLRNGLLFGSAALLPRLEVALSVEEPVSPETDRQRLFHAIIDGQIDVVETLIRSGVDVNIKNRYSCSALFIAVGLGSTDPVVDMAVLKLLVENGVDVNAKTDDGDTPLHTAAAWRSVEMVEFLVSTGADVRAQDIHGVTPLDLAMIRFEDDKTKENAAVFEYLSGIPLRPMSLRIS